MPIHTARSPLAMIMNDARRSVGEALASGTHQAKVGSDLIDSLGGGLLAAMGMGEIADDLDVRGLALLSAAVIAGLEVLGQQDPAIHRLDDAIRVLEDLLRRSAASVGR